MSSTEGFEPKGGRFGRRPVQATKGRYHMLQRSHKHARLGRSGGRVTLFIMTLLILGLTAQAAFAVSPHFISASAARSGDNLVVTWKEAGLGNNENIDYTASATATREDSCVNKGGNIPSDPKKTTTAAQVSSEGTFSVKNGSVNGSLTLSPPATTLTCPKGQTATLISLAYTNVSITDDTNGITRTIPGTF
jgi:outer membrane usher protein FimD/PapC